MSSPEQAAESGTLAVCAPAKVNLYLAVGPKRDDGYHDLQTIFHALELHDRVTVTPADAMSLACEPPLDITAEQNIAFRAAEALAEAVGREARVSIVIEKHIPDAAGLGGGSADAAAVIWALCRMWGLDPTTDTVMRAAASVGADVPFFLVGGAAHFKGRGDRLVRPLSALDVAVVLVNPGVPTPTADVYRVFDELPVSGIPGIREAADAIRFRDLSALGGAVFNGLADAAVAVSPDIAPCREWLAAQGGISAAEVSGSGATVFGICGDDATAEQVAEAASQRGWWSCATRTRPGGVAACDGGGAP